MSGISRRGFLAGAVGAVVTGPPFKGLGALVQVRRFDTVIAGGRVYDASRGIAGRRDIGILGGKIAAVEERIPAEQAGRLVDASGLIVTPGLIDIHTHVFPGVPTLGIDPDLVGIAKGVTTLADAGSSGATTFPAFKRDVAQRARTRVYALLNMSRVGMTVSNELADLDWLDVDAVVEAIEQNRDVAIGIKVRMLAGLPDGQDLEVMRRTREAADRADVPVTVHIGGQTSPLPRILEFLRPGDVLTHALRRQGSILDANQRVYPEVLEAMRSGVYLDVGHGRGNLDFEVAELVLDQGVVPTVISSDVHDGNVAGPVFGLPNTLSKFMMLGLTLEQVIEAATVTPGAIFDFGPSLGTLAVGASADVALFEMVERPYTFVDSTGNRRTGERRLSPYLALRDGLVYGLGD